MITIPTVLVFGAGVSRPFGFPLGVELRNQIINNLEPNNGYYRELRDIGFADRAISAFRNAFWDSGKESVDAFLEHRTDYLEVGKAAIAQELTRYESHGNLFANAAENLYFYLYKHLNAPPADFKNNTLAVLTYNYDRSFEQFLFTSLRNSYGLTDKDTAELLKCVPIIHLHGHLGLLPWQGDGGRKYGSEERLNDIRVASKNIRIIHEQIDVDKEPQFRLAHHEIRHASRVIFLGFGYDKINLQRLRVPTKSTDIRLFGSCYGLTENEKSNMNQKLFDGRALLGDTRFDALNFLRNNLSLS